MRMHTVLVKLILCVTEERKKINVLFPGKTMLKFNNTT